MLGFVAAAWNSDRRGEAAILRACTRKMCSAKGRFVSAVNVLVNAGSHPKSRLFPGEEPASLRVLSLHGAAQGLNHMTPKHSVMGDGIYIYIILV